MNFKQSLFCRKWAKLFLHFFCAKIILFFSRGTKTFLMMQFCDQRETKTAFFLISIFRSEIINGLFTRTMKTLSLDVARHC
jgi:hypothetical protein